MVLADDPLLQYLRPLFDPTSVASALTSLQFCGEEAIRNCDTNTATTSLSQCCCSSAKSANNNSSARCQCMISLLIVLRNKVKTASKQMLKNWCFKHFATRSSLEKTIEAQQEAKFLNVGGGGGGGQQVQVADELNNSNISRSENDDIIFSDATQGVTEIPSLLLLCSFVITYLPRLPMKERNQAFTSAIRLVQSEGELIIRDDITLEEVIEFALDVGNVPRTRWLPSSSHSHSHSHSSKQEQEQEKEASSNYSQLLQPSSFLAIKVMTLLWSLVNSFFSSSLSSSSLSLLSSKSNSPLTPYLVSILCDPHLLLWSAWSTNSAPDAIILESAEEAFDVLDQDLSDVKIDEEFSYTKTKTTATGVVTTGVVILLVQDTRNWSRSSIIQTCEFCKKKNLPVSVWIDSHECGDLTNDVVASSEWQISPVLLQWIGDALTVTTTSSSSCNNDDDNDENEKEQQQQQQKQIDSFIYNWIKLALTSNPTLIPVESQRDNVIAACITCMKALDQGAAGICGIELSRILCSWIAPQNNYYSYSTCWIGLLAYVVARLPDVVPSYSHHVSSSATTASISLVVSPKERVLASLRATSPPLPPGISMSPDTLFVFRLAERLPIDYFSAFWVSLLLLTSTLNSSSSSSSTLTTEEKSSLFLTNWKPDATLPKLSQHWQTLFGTSSNNNNNDKHNNNSRYQKQKTTSSSSSGLVAKLEALSASFSSSPTTAATATTNSNQNDNNNNNISQNNNNTQSAESRISTNISNLSNSISMCKAFTFVLNSYFDESLSSSQQEAVEEAVGRLKAVADVIDRHRSVEVRAATQSISASHWELQSLVDVHLLQRFATVEQQLTLSSSASASSFSAGEKQNESHNNNTNNNNFSPSTSSSIINNNNSDTSLLQSVNESFESRMNLASSWRKNGSFAKRNFRAAMIVAQQVGKVFENEAEKVVARLLQGGSGVQPIVVLRMRSELEMISDYYRVANDTAAKALGGQKGRNLLYVSEKLQEAIRLIRAAL